MNATLLTSFYCAFDCVLGGDIIPESIVDKMADFAWLVTLVSLFHLQMTAIVSSHTSYSIKCN